MPEELGEQVRASFRVGKTYLAYLVTDKPEGWEPTWTLSHFNMPFSVLRDKNKHYYYTPGIPGLWFCDKPSPLEVRDTRRNSDWYKLQDKRVVRRMHRQMAKTFAGATDLKTARNHKR
jgi:hypothetical protein